MISGPLGIRCTKEAIEEIIEDFNQSQNEIHVNYKYQPWGDIWTKSLSAITAGNAPDVIVQDINSVAQRAEAQQATNLSKYVEKTLLRILSAALGYSRI